VSNVTEDSQIRSVEDSLLRRFDGVVSHATVHAEVEASRERFRDARIRTSSQSWFNATQLAGCAHCRTRLAEHDRWVKSCAVDAWPSRSDPVERHLRNRRQVAYRA
jgi:hypothetical protein